MPCGTSRSCKLFSTTPHVFSGANTYGCCLLLYQHPLSRVAGGVSGVSPPRSSAALRRRSRGGLGPYQLRTARGQVHMIRYHQRDYTMCVFPQCQRYMLNRSRPLPNVTGSCPSLPFLCMRQNAVLHETKEPLTFKVACWSDVGDSISHFHDLWLWRSIVILTLRLL